MARRIYYSCDCERYYALQDVSTTAVIDSFGEYLITEGAQAGRAVGVGCTNFLEGLGGIISVLDIDYEVYKIVKAVEQVKTITNKLNDIIRPGYIKPVLLSTITLLCNTKCNEHHQQ